MTLAGSIGGIVWGLFFSRVVFIVLGSDPANLPASGIEFKVLTTLAMVAMFVLFLEHTVPHTKKAAEAHWYLTNLDGLDARRLFDLRSQFFGSIVKGTGSFSITVWILSLIPRVFDTKGQVNVYHVVLLGVLFALVISETWRSRKHELLREESDG